MSRVRRAAAGLLALSLIIFHSHPAASQSGDVTLNSSLTVLAFDTSGSMAEADSSGLVKIDAARRAANTLINLIETENSIQASANQVAVTQFNTSASSLLGMSANLAGARGVINGLSAGSLTNMTAGLNVALDEFTKTRNAAPGAKRFIVLLSDGLPTVTVSGQRANTTEELKREVLDGPVQRAKRENVCVNVIGLGAGGGQIDEDFLRQITQDAGCGEYVNAADASLLGAAYVKLRHASLGTVLNTFRGSINQGQTAPVGDVFVPAGKDELHVTLQWPGSALDLNLADPAGKKVSAAYPGATINTFSNLVYAIIKQPMEGKWTATTFGRVVPEGTLKWDSVFSVRGAAKTAVTQKNNTDWGPILFVLMALLVAMGLGAMVVITSRGQSGANGLVVLSGARAPLRVSPGRRLRLGRDDYNDVILTDSRASRAHAEIYAHEDGSFTVRDLGSRNGTRLNGKRIHAARAYPGDTLQIGRTELELE